MPLRPRLHVLRVPPVLVLAVVLSGCPFPIPPFGFGPPLPGTEEPGIVIENATDEDWIVSASAGGLWSFAVPAATTGHAVLYGGMPTGIVLMDRDCSEVDHLDVGDEPLLGIRIDPPGTLVRTDANPEPPDDLGLLSEVFDCGFGSGMAPQAGDAVTDAPGTLLLIGGDSQAWVLEPSSGSLESAATVEDELTVGDYSWSPDGEQLAYSRYADDGRQPVYVLARGGEPRLLADNGAAPIWSPAGDRIAYVSLDPFDGGSALMVVDADGGEPIRVAQGVGPAAWSPDGDRIAYVSHTDASLDPFAAEAAELHVVDADGGDRIALGEAMAFGRAPSWSPDGSRIAFTGGGMGGTDVRIVPADGGESTLVDNPQGSMLGEPVWSPDGATLAVTLTATGFLSVESGIAVVDVASGDVSPLASSADDFFMTPAWSPDGRWIASVRLGAAATGSLVVTDTRDGTEVVVAENVLAIAGWGP